MPNTHDIAADRSDRESTGADNNGDGRTDSESGGYFAILAFDGDQIGKWISGALTPRLSGQLADYSKGSERQGARQWFERHLPDALNLQRPVSPSYHLQFSQCLSQFAGRCARTLVEDYGGRLIYAGGDDVLAMLPASRAIDCAVALRLAFRGDPGLKAHLARTAARSGILRVYESPEGPVPGFLVCDDWRGKDSNGQLIPFLVPGPAAEASVGIAVAHSKHPLQNVVQAASAAERRAKGEYGRAAVALSILKRSGEILEWGCRWDDSQGGALAFLSAFLESRRRGTQGASASLPQKYIALIAPYIGGEQRMADSGNPDDPGFQATVNEILMQEFALGLEAQGGSDRHVLRQHFGRYLESLADQKHSASERVRRSLGLMRTAGWLARAKT